MEFAASSEAAVMYVLCFCVVLLLLLLEGLPAKRQARLLVNAIANPHISLNPQVIPGEDGGSCINVGRGPRAHLPLLPNDSVGRSSSEVGEKNATEQARRLGFSASCLWVGSHTSAVKRYIGVAGWLVAVGG